MADVPSGEAWLGTREQRVLAGLRVEPRRVAWRLGRWTAKAALGAWLDVAPGRLEVIAGDDGAPEAWLDGQLLPLSVSLSHRGDRALAIVSDPPRVAGCDLELVEPRSDAFVRTWLAPAEQQLVWGTEETRRALIANLIWTAKEAAAKVRREGLRLDVRGACVTPALEGVADGGWRPLRVEWEDARAVAGWWRSEPGWVMSVAADPPPASPRALRALSACT